MIITRINEKTKSSYTNSDAVENVINYITRSNKADVESAPYAIGGIGVNLYDPKEMCRQFREVQAIYRKENYGVRLIHEVVSFYPYEIYDKNGKNQIEEIAYKFSAIYFLSGFQAVYGIHMDTEKPHIHYAINATNFMDGYKFNYKLPDARHRMEYLVRVMAECLNAVPVVYWNGDVGWTPEYYDVLQECCDHSGFLKG